MVKKIIIISVSVVFLGLIGFYGGCGIIIKSYVAKVCHNATVQFSGHDKVNTLISVLKSDGLKLKEKNDAIYALGYVRDIRALPALRALRTGKPCDHGKYVCQRELNRTIGYLEGNLNVYPNFK
jgi:hypothetical protein